MEGKFIYLVLLAIVAHTSALGPPTSTLNPGSLAVQAKLQADFLKIQSAKTQTHSGLESAIDFFYLWILKLQQSLCVDGDVPDQSAALAEGKRTLTTSFRLGYDGFKKQFDLLKSEDAVVDNTNKNLAYAAINRTVEILLGVLSLTRTSTNKTALRSELASTKEVFPIVTEVLNTIFGEIQAASSTQTEVVSAIENIRRLAIIDCEDILTHMFRTVDVVVDHDCASTKVPAVDKLAYIRAQQFRGITFVQDYIVSLADLVRTLLIFSTEHRIGDVIAFNKIMDGYVNGGSSFVGTYAILFETIANVTLASRNEALWNSAQTEANKQKVKDSFKEVLGGFHLAVSTLYPADIPVDKSKLAASYAVTNEIIDLIWRALGLAQNHVTYGTTLTEIEEIEAQVISKIKDIVSISYTSILKASSNKASVVASIAKAKVVSRAEFKTILDEVFNAIKLLLLARQDSDTPPTKDVIAQIHFAHEKVHASIIHEHLVKFEIIRNIRIFQALNETVDFAVIDSAQSPVSSTSTHGRQDVNFQHGEL